MRAAKQNQRAAAKGAGNAARLWGGGAWGRRSAEAGVKERGGGEGATAVSQAPSCQRRGVADARRLSVRDATRRRTRAKPWSTKRNAEGQEALGARASFPPAAARACARGTPRSTRLPLFRPKRRRCGARGGPTTQLSSSSSSSLLHDKRPGRPAPPPHPAQQGQGRPPVESAKKKKKQGRRQKTSITRGSQEITQPSTNHAQTRLTSEFEWDQVHSSWYERSMERRARKLNIFCILRSLASIAGRRRAPAASLALSGAAHSIAHPSTAHSITSSETSAHKLSPMTPRARLPPAPPAG